MTSKRTTRTMARYYGPPPGDSSLGFIIWHGRRGDRTQQGVGSLSNAELAWAARVIVAELGRRKQEKAGMA